MSRMSKRNPRKRNNLGYYIKEGTFSVFTHGFMSFASVAIIVACLVIMGSFLLVAMNVNDLIEEMENRNEVVAIVDEVLSEEEARAIESSILAVENVYSATFESREEAWDRWREDHPEHGEGLGPDVLRHRYIIVLEDIAYMEATTGHLLEVTGIVEVLDDPQIADWFVALRNVISTVFLAIVGVLLIISIFIISNTIKLATFDRREEIAIMRMVGATNWFIRWPFIFQGFILGLTGAIFAFFLQWGIYGILADQIMRLSGGGLITVLSFYEIADLMIMLFVGTGFVVGTIGSAIAIRNYLKV